MINVDSKAISAIGYEDHELIVELKSGSAYQYSKVPELVWEAFESSKSKGKYYNEHIRKRYETTKLS